MNDAEIKLQVKIDDSSAVKSLDSMSSKTQALSKSFTDAGKGLTLGLTLPIAGLIGTGIKYNATVETLTSSFETMTGSAEEAGDIVKRLKTIGSKTPFEFTDLAETTKLLMNYGLTADDAIDKMQMLGDISQGNAEKIGRVSMAYGQMSSAGKVSLEDVKQMIEAGFNPLKEISESTGESMSSLYDRISKGSISVDEITASMVRSTSEGGKYFGSMDAQSQTTAGKMSTLKDEFLNATGSLTESLMPVFQQAIGLLTQFSNWLGTLNQDQLTMIVNIGLVVASIGPLLLILGSFARAISAIDLAMKIMSANPIILTIAGITLLVVALVAVFAILAYEVSKNWDVISEILSGMWKRVKDIFSAIGNFIGDTFKGIVNIAIWMINKVIDVFNLMAKIAMAPINAIISGLNLVPGVNIPKLSFSIPNIPKLEVGTNFVAQEGLAYLHQGEAVVPKKYNPAIGGSGFATIKIEMGDIEMDGTKVGRAMTPYITKTIKLGGGE